MTGREDVPVLALDTSGAAVTVGIGRLTASGARVAAHRTVVGGGRHAEVLAPAIDAVLAEAGIDAAGVGAVVAGDGPGPYTGLRVGLATAAAYADALAVPVYGVCSLDAIALAVAERADGPYLVAGDARRKEIYWGIYAAGRRRRGPEVDTPARVAGLLGAEGAVAMAGAGAHMYADVLGLPLLEQPHPGVAALIDLAADRIRDGAAAEILQPRYLRHPDAAPPGERKQVTRG